MSTETTERPRVYLNSVHLKGFKSIEDLTIDFQKGLNILIGKNGSGKSNFLEFIEQIFPYKKKSNNLFKYARLNFSTHDNHLFSVENERDSQIRPVNNHFPDKSELTEKFFIDDIVVFDNSEDIDFRKKIEFRNIKFSYRNISLAFINMGYDFFFPVSIKYNLPESLSFVDSAGLIKIDLQDGIPYWIFPETLNFISTAFYRTEAFYTDGPNKLENEPISKILKHFTIPDEIIENLKLYTTIEDVRFNNNIQMYKAAKFDTIDEITLDNVKLEFKVNGNWLPWSQLSDGTRRLFYIVTQVTSSVGLILLEEPELGIHPHQFNLLMDFLKEQSEDKQIIISTHSPKALDHLSPEELNNILIAYYDLDKGTQIRHLSEKEIKKAQKYMKEVGFFSDYWMLSDLE